jgi:hypothetical protein
MQNMFPTLETGSSAQKLPTPLGRFIARIPPNNPKRPYLVILSHDWT